MNTPLLINAHTGLTGEFKARVHTGHTYDAKGNIIAEGIDLGGSEWGKNTITLGGFNAMMVGAVNIKAVAGVGNTAPAEANTVLASYRGAESTKTLTSMIVYTTPVSGYYRIEYIFRATFNPGALGSGAINVAEAGMAMTSGTPNSSTPLFARGLLVDGGGAPTTVSMDASTEYLDIFWKYTRYIPAEITGTQNITILGVVTPHDYIIRPVFLDPNNAPAGASTLSIWWNLGLSANALPGWGLSVSDTSYGGASFGPRVFDGDISANVLTGVPAGTTAMQSSYTAAAYVANSKERSFSLNFLPTDANLASHIRSMTLKWNLLGLQMQFNPRIQKNATPARVLRLDFKISVANHVP